MELLGRVVTIFAISAIITAIILPIYIIKKRELKAKQKWNNSEIIEK